ncbi:ATP-binding protein [Roseibium suaedae]|uniref:histidine kinase n=1 Tax=Roseibium suaedae TaxID=735517 RepID=A0A1M7H0Q8_9HYPH|nr:ATP-binding protein [Roseibium suaedae]SHM22090.1 Signal transduction histidine kinase [Roseibium suaedae]
MTRLISRLWPESIAAQLLLVMLTSLGMLVMLFYAAFRILQPGPPGEDAFAYAMKAAVLVAQMNEADAGRRETLVADFTRRNPNLHLRLMPSGSYDPPSREGDRSRVPFWMPFRVADFGSGLKSLGLGPTEIDEAGEERANLVFELADGQQVFARMPPRKEPPIWGNPLLQLIFFLVLSLVMLLIWGTRMLVQPLSQLASGVGNFGKTSMRAVPIAAHGPLEVRKAAHAFNRMQNRIQDLVERRTRMLAAISHDLRTPLTRLRLRTELMPDGDIKQRNLADLSIMEGQLGGALTYLSEGRTGEPDVKIDVASFLQGIRDQYEDVGAELALDCEVGLSVLGRFSELTRAMTNLIDNARRYDDRIRLISCYADDRVIIEVEDHGPGIPIKDRERMLMPFERGDEARMLGSDSSFGFGLGLATACAIVEAHDGNLYLNDTKGGGLTVRIELPQA